MYWLVSTSLQFRVLLAAASIVLIAAGVRTARDMPLDVFPEFAPPRVEVQTEAPGLSTEEVESLVTIPLENSLNGVPWLRTLRSKSVLGLSSIELQFAPGTDIMLARQAVQERVAAEAGRLPAAARPPVILSALSATSRALKIGVWSKVNAATGEPILSQMDLTILARWTIRPRLMSIPGVANVAIWGQRDKQFQVLLDPDRLRLHEVTVQEVLRAAGDTVALDTGGFVDTPNQRMAVRIVYPALDPAELAATVVAQRNGAAIRLGDVARVVVDHPPPIGDGVINDGPGLLLIVEKQPWGNTMDVTRQVEAALAALAPGLKDVEVDPTIFRPATFIERAFENLNKAMAIGGALVVLVLVIFLFDWRTALISLIAMPMSLAAAVLALAWLGHPINTMVLAGLVIALGEVVDDAIIDVENIMRRLRQNAAEGRPESSFQVVLKASLEVRSSVVYASLIVILVFLPVFFLEGLAGTFFRPLAGSYVLAILASLAVALTATPALCLMLLPRAAERRRESPTVSVLRRLYAGVLPAFVARPAVAVVVILAAFGVTIAAVTRLGEEFLPDFHETDFLMHWVEKPGTSVEASQRITARVSKELRTIPGVRNFGAHIGRAEVADEVVGPNFTELWISIDPKVPYEPTIAKIQEVVDGYPGLYRDLLTYLKERIKEVLTGAGATIVVRLYGPDLDVLRAKAKEVEAEMKTVAGVANLKIEPQVLVPQVRITVKPDALRRFRTTAGQVRRSVTTLVRGVKVGEVFDEQKVFDVVLWGEPAARKDVEALRAMPISVPVGAHVPLRELADVDIVPAPNEIKREGASRRLDVTCNVSGRDLGAVAREIEEKVRKIPFPREYHPEFLGEYAARQESRDRLIGLSAAALAGIFLLLRVDFGSFRTALLVGLTLPFALVGGVAGAFVGGGVLSLGSLVGFVTVLGIAARNGIMLVSHYRHLELEEGVPFGRELILRGSQERLAPILMTALTAGLALVPLVIAGNVPGHEIEYPMAVVIIGGLVTSTVMNVLLVPALYAAFGRPSVREE